MRDATGPVIRVLLADDHPVVRDGLAAMLSTQPDLTVVGEAATGAEALHQTASLAPDVVLMDLQMAWTARPRPPPSVPPTPRCG
ncbi:hypothetical protein ALMP_57160 [Streptomyces sp. A012304]|nr:response regulator transcription factor [Streptomyces sp. A012304]GKQ39187.1 hypothetical protein ALMP_57160 [Streptomyces sp. A012304]